MLRSESTSPRNFKHLTESLEVFERLNRSHYCVIDKPDHQLDKCFCTLAKAGHKGFSATFSDQPMNFYRMEDVEHIIFQTSVDALFVEKLRLTTVTSNSAIGEVSQFGSVDFEKTKLCYYRLIIPIEKPIDISRHLQPFIYETKRNRSAECVRIDYKEAICDMYVHRSAEEKKYLIIDVDAKLNFEAFSEYCFSSLVCFGYMTGTMPGNEGYFFSYDSLDLEKPSAFYYTEFRNTMNVPYTPIYVNAYGFISDKKLAKQTQPTLRTLSKKEFSVLCQWSYESVHFSSVLLLIMEAAGASLTLMPAAFSVALEGITDLIASANEEKMLPLSDKRASAAIRTELLSVIKRYKETYRDKDDYQKGLKIFENKLNMINSPTNQDKLTKPFNLLGINLSKADMEAIGHRNDFLHGRLTLAMATPNQEITKKVYYVSLKLYTLISALILKQVGFDNKILNHAKKHESITGVKLTEEYYRQI